MDKVLQLKDGREVVIRPLAKDDVDRSLAFFRGLPDEDRAYLRVDVTKREVMERRIREIDLGRVGRLVAVSYA